MITRLYRLLCFLILISLIGCSRLPFSFGDGLHLGTPSHGATQTRSASGPQDDHSTMIPLTTQVAANATQVPGEQAIRLWLTPEFDPGGASAASSLLKARLAKFEVEYPSVRLEVRVKALDGSGGLLDSLVATSVAAPTALPDLVLLPRPLLESAALKGLLYPYDGLTNILDDQSWFEYARQLAQLKGSAYGIPFAGDSLVLAHSSSLLATPPPSLEATISNKEVLLYPAGDTQALFTIGMYLAEGGKLQDDQGRPSLEEEPLINILSYYERARLAQVMPYTLTEYIDDAQVWEAFLAGQSTMAVTWASTYLRYDGIEQTGLVIAPLPTPDGTPFTLATGWSWALAGQDPARRLLSVKLAEYLVDKEFLAEWTQLAGYLPPRVDALQGWQEASLRQEIERISYSAWLLPSADLISTVGPILQQTIKSVLTGVSDAQSAARLAIDQLNQP